VNGKQNSISKHAFVKTNHQINK